MIWHLVFLVGGIILGIAGTYLYFVTGHKPP